MPPSGATLVCGLLLVIALGCAFKLYSLRTQEYRWALGPERRFLRVAGERAWAHASCSRGPPTQGFSGLGPSGCPDGGRRAHILGSGKCDPHPRQAGLPCCPSAVALRAFETQMTRLEAEFVRREAPPSYGQLIAQGLIPPVEDFPVYSASQVSRRA